MLWRRSDVQGLYASKQHYILRQLHLDGNTGQHVSKLLVCMSPVSLHTQVQVLMEDEARGANADPS